jgi:hypothetical protein
MKNIFFVLAIFLSGNCFSQSATTYESDSGRLLIKITSNRVDEQRVTIEQLKYQREESIRIFNYAKKRKDESLARIDSLLLIARRLNLPE